MKAVHWLCVAALLVPICWSYAQALTATGSKLVIVSANDRIQECIGVSGNSFAPTEGQDVDPVGGDEVAYVKVR